MPKLREIAAIINATVKAGAFDYAAFQPAVFSGVVELISRTEEDQEKKQPVLVANDGSCTDISIDDVNPMQLYHRIIGIEEGDPEDNSFGAPGNTLREVANMRLIVMGDRGRVNAVPEDIMAAVALWMPRELSKIQLQQLGLYDCMIIPGEISLNMEEVFSEELSGTAFNLTPGSIMASMNYRIVTEFNQTCFKICN